MKHALQKALALTASLLLLCSTSITAFAAPPAVDLGEGIEIKAVTDFASVANATQYTTLPDFAIRNGQPGTGTFQDGKIIFTEVTDASVAFAAKADVSNFNKDLLKAGDGFAVYVENNCENTILYRPWFAKGKDLSGNNLIVLWDNANPAHFIYSEACGETPKGTKITLESANGLFMIPTGAKGYVMTPFNCFNNWKAGQAPFDPTTQDSDISSIGINLNKWENTLSATQTVVVGDYCVYGTDLPKDPEKPFYDGKLDKAPKEPQDLFTDKTANRLERFTKDCADITTLKEFRCYQTSLDAAFKMSGSIHDGALHITGAHPEGSTDFWMANSTGKAFSKAITKDAEGIGFYFETSAAAPVSVAYYGGGEGVLFQFAKGAVRIVDLEGNYKDYTDVEMAEVPAGFKGYILMDRAAFIDAFTGKPITADRAMNCVGLRIHSTPADAATDFIMDDLFVFGAKVPKEVVIVPTETTTSETATTTDATEPEVTDPTTDTNPPATGEADAVVVMMALLAVSTGALFLLNKARKATH